MSELIRTLVVDDSAANRRVVSDILEQTGLAEVIGVARDGEDALHKALDLKPDLVTLDLEMPKMDGFTFLRILMKSRPVPVLVISSIAQEKMVFRALELGAVDFLAKPEEATGHDLMSLQADLAFKVKGIRELQMGNVQRRLAESAPVPAPVKVPRPVPAEELARTPLIVIGSSTGGPAALQAIFSNLPADLPAGIAVAQHMPPGFTRAFAERLDKSSAFAVKEADDRDALTPGSALIAPGGRHLTLERRGEHIRARLHDAAPEDKYVPSVDRLFESVAGLGEEALGVVLTGMGNDGAAGAAALKKAGGVVLAEAESSAIVYGMPREAVQAGAVEREAPLEEMTDTIVSFHNRMLRGMTEEGGGAALSSAARADVSPKDRRP